MLPVWYLVTQRFAGRQPFIARNKMRHRMRSRCLGDVFCAFHLMLLDRKALRDAEALGPALALTRG
jgi:hypothetical protein